MKRFLLPEYQPQIAESAWIASNATLVGSVVIGDRSSVWYGAVLRGDIHHIRVGAESNIQDLSVVHVADDYATEIGNRVSVGHRAIVHACRIGDETLVGMGAIIMDGVEIGEGCVIGAGALVTKGMVIAPGHLVMGSPARIIRVLSVEERRANVALAEKYVESSTRFKNLLS